MAQCSECGTALTLRNTMPSGLCGRCHGKKLEASISKQPDNLSSVEKRLAEEREAQDKIVAARHAIRSVLVTTEMQPDINIQRRVTIVTAEVAYGMNIFKDIFSSVRNIVGGRSEAIQKTMRDARETVLYELKREAHAVGANAVVGVDLDYTQIGDNGWNMVLLVASGTAVVIEA